jgi:orotate phosphoribosyltransferase
MNKKLIDMLEDFNCIHSNKEKNIKLASGKSSSIYYDIKKASGIPDLFTFIISELKLIIPHNSSIVAVSTGGIPYSAALSYEYKTDFAYVRESVKEYGMNNIIEGVINTDKEIYIIDDVCTTGKSILKAKKTVENFISENGLNKTNIHLVSVVNRKLNNLKISSIIEV